MLRSHETYPSKRPQPEKARADKRKLAEDPIDKINHDRAANRAFYLEKTDLGNQEHRALVEKWDTFTEQELARTRAEIDDIIFPRHHPNTSLPYPRE